MGVVPQHTPDVELPAPGIIGDPVPTPDDDDCRFTEVLRRVEDKSLTDDFVTADIPDDVVAIDNGGCDL